jgi:amidophosphoribosyltransferase
MAVKGVRFEKKIHDISQGSFKFRFGGDVPAMEGTMGIGVISDSDAQPLLIRSRLGLYALAMTGFIENKDDLTNSLLQQGQVFTESSQAGVNGVEVLARIIESGRDLVDGLTSVFRQIEGAASMLLLTADGILAARDLLGRTPLVIGQRDRDFMVASESIALMNLGFLPVKELGPGEIVRIHPDGYEVLHAAQPRMRMCSFLWIYTGYPGASYEGIGVEGARERCGIALARRDIVQADLAAGVPDSGIGHGIGYAMQAGIPFRRALVKYTPGYGRSYIPPTQAMRDHVARMKLIAVPEVVSGNRCVVCEDSIVRGTQLANYTIQKLWDAGAKEIHMRPACPPLMFPCRYGFSTRGLDELVARRAILALEGDPSRNLDRYIDEDSDEHARMVDWIREYVHVTTLRYQRLDDMIEAIGMPEDRLCTYCWSGRRSGYRDEV